MTGRPRRASTSSVESECESDVRWRQESSVVRTVLKEAIPDDWPIFELANAIVLDKDGQNMENALLVGKRGPFIIRGDLIIDDPCQKSHLIMRVRTSTPLEIRRSTLYSIGESEDGRPLIWVSGQGGWYEIDPCRAYKPIYRKMCEATTMYYALLDIYTETPPKKCKRGKTPTFMEELGPVFHKYAVRIGDGSTFEEVVARAREHAVFFLSKLSQNDCSLDWSTTAFYKWIFSGCAGEGEGIPVMLAPVPCSASQQEPHRSETEDSLGDKSLARPISTNTNTTSTSTNTNTTSTSTSTSTTSTGTGKVAGADADVVDSNVYQAPRSRRIRLISSASRMAERPAPATKEPPPQSTVSHPSATNTNTHPVIPLYEPSDRDNERDSPLQIALAIVDGCYDELAPGRNGMTFSRTLTRLYFAYSFPNFREGGAGAYKQPIHEWIHYYSKALLPLLDEKYREQEIYTELERLAKTELKLVCYKPSDFPVIITSRNSQPRKPAAGHTSSAPLQTPNRNRDSSAGGSPRPMGKRPTRTPGKSSLQPTGRAPKKRLRREFESDNADSDPASQVKKSHYFAEQDVDMDDIQVVDSGDENEAEDAAHPTTDGPDGYGLEPIKLVIRAEKMPESSPRGPDDTWVCDQDGCGYIVRGSSEQDCRDRIQQHFRDHEQQLTRVNLAMTESARGHMPINHLLEKIKQLRGEPSPPQIQPIKRKLIV